MAEFSFNAQAHTPASNPVRSPLPKGTYQAIVMDSAIKPTKAGTGQYIELTLQVVDGPHAGRRLWDRLNVSNPNKQAEDIALAQLQSLCQAVGVTNMTDTFQLHDRPFTVSVDIDRKEPDRNRIVSYLSSAWADNVPPSARPAPPAASAAAAKKPWER
ncbi:Protein of unknown function DUF669 [uncultured Caudovirales phage]|uniref:DUF669 domain-containing protein n=1 Tax=uncultured Caudovirales phage TaxID=2100421 RepID=A0A6J5P2N7_9CAUD|nr:Protein of unknown function DUF669 [uncultured Caudovirales phage]